MLQDLPGTFPSQIESLNDLIASAAQRFGESTFLDPAEDGLDPISFVKLAQIVDCVDRFLASEGTERGGTVATLLHNGTPLCLLFLGVIGSYRTLVPLNPKSAPKEIEYILGQTKPGVVFFDAELTDRLESLPADCVAIAVDTADRFIDLVTRVHGGDRRNESREGRAKVAEVVYTSGSTGLPKGVVLSPMNLLSNSWALADLFAFTPNSRLLTVCPLFHNSGQLFTTLTALWAGCRTTPVRSDTGMLQFWYWANRKQANWTLVMNAFLALLLQREEAPGESAFCGIVAGGSKLPPELIDRFESRFKIPVYQCYGLTETTSIATVEAPRYPRVRGSAGRSVNSCEVGIWADGRLQPAGQSGEIIIRGDNVMTGYLDLKELTRQKIVDGWLYSGDLGSLDHEGNLYIHDRLDMVITVGGENVYPSEVENLVPQLEGVEEAVLCPVPDAILGNELVLVFKVRAGTATAPRQWAKVFKQHLSSFRIPRRWVDLRELGVTEFPRAPNGKLRRGEVRKALLAQQEA